MRTDLLIIGQGICGSFLQWYAKAAGLSVLVIDESKANSASKMAAGIINPVTGRRIVKTWMIEDLLLHTVDAYAQIGAAYGGHFLSEKNILDFFPTPQMLLAYRSRYEEDRQFLRTVSDDPYFSKWFQYDFGYGEIDPCYLADLPALLAAVKQRLRDEQSILEEAFRVDELRCTEKEVLYRGIRASHIIFCDGVEGFQNPYFSKLPFAPNKGEALLIEADGVPLLHIYKKGLSLVPLPNNLFWVGSSYQWEFDHAEPTASFLAQTEATLKKWLKVPFRIVEHIAAVRPATLERRPFVGFHPAHKNLGILNGMGTKGCSLAPFFADQLVQHIVSGSNIQPEADIKRFARVLGRN